MPRMFNEVPAEAPDRDTVFTWQAEGCDPAGIAGRRHGGAAAVFAARGARFGVDQMSALPYTVFATSRCRCNVSIVATEEEADEFPLDDDEVEVIVGSRQFDLVDLIEEELLLSLPLVPKHDVCPEVHESLVSGSGGRQGDEVGWEAVRRKRMESRILLPCWRS